MINMGNGFNRLLAVTAAALFVCAIHATALAGDAQTREALYAEVLAQAQADAPERRGVAHDLETDPEFLKRLSAALHAFESSRIQPIATSGELIEQGACPKLPCGPLSTRSARGETALPTVQSTRVSPVVSGGDSVVLRWDRPSARARYGSNSPIPIRYDVLVVDNHHYHLYQVSDPQTFVSPRGNRGRPSGSRPIKPTKPGMDSLTKPGQEAAPARPLHADWRVPQQYFVLPLKGLVRPSIYIRPVYAETGSAKKQSGGDATAAATGSPTTASGSTPAGFSDPLIVDLGLAQQRSEAGGGAHQSPEQRCVIDEMARQKKSRPAQLQSLDCTGYGVTSLTGIDQLTNLQTLTLDDNPLSDITVLSQLYNLRSLSLAFTNVHSIDALLPLTQLESLIIANTQITDINGLANFNALETLHAQNNQIIQIPDLSATAVRSLYLGGNPITDVSGVRGLNTLEELKLNGTDVGDLDPVIDNAQLPQSLLATVDLSNNLSLYCPQLQVLETVLGSTNVISPASCKQIPIPINLNPSANPVVGSNFSLGWNLSGHDTANFSYQVERLDSSRGASELYSVQQGEIQYVNTDQLPFGTHQFSVKACLSAGSGQECGGESQILEIVILGDPARNIADAISEIQDLNLEACVTQASSGMVSAGELTSLTCIRRNIETLAGLEHFPSLDRLTLNENQINHVEALQYLPALYRLQIAMNEIPDDQLGYIALGGGGRYFDLNLGANGLDGNGLVSLERLRQPDPDDASVPGLAEASWFSIWGNSIQSIEPISGAFISTLYAWNNQINSVPSLSGVRTLSLSNNLIAELPGFCEPGTQGCHGQGVALADTLISLELNNNPSIGQTQQNYIALSNLNSLRNVKLSNTGLVAVLFAENWNQLEYIDISYNEIDKLNALSNNANLNSINVSGTAIESFNSLSGLNLSALIALDARNINSLNRIQDLSASTFVFSLSNSSLDPIDGLNPLSEVKQLYGLYLEGNDVFNIEPIFQAIDYTPGLRINYTVRLENKINCAQISLAIGHPQYAGVAYANSCMPSIPEFQELRLQENLDTISVAWSPAVEAPAGIEGELSHYNVQFNLSNGEGGSLDGWPRLVSVPAGQQSLDWSDMDFDPGLPVDISIQSCRVSDGECSPFSESSYPVYPLMQITDVSGHVDSSGAATIEWSYPSIPSQGQNLEFEIRPLFPVIDPIAVPWSSGSGASWSYVIPNIDDFPGRIVRLVACNEFDGVRECGESIEFDFRDIEITPDIPALSNQPELTLVGNSGEMSLTWDDIDHPLVDYYRIREYSGTSETAKTYAIEESQMQPMRFSKENFRDTAFEVSACQKINDGPDRCGSGSVSQQLFPILNRSFVAPDNLCWFEDDETDAQSSQFVKFRWQYDLTQPGFDVPQEFRLYRNLSHHAPNPTRQILGGDIQFFQSQYAPDPNFQLGQEPLDANDYWYWESGMISAWFDVDHSLVSKFKVRPAVDGQTSGDIYDSEIISPYIYDGSSYVLDESTRCPEIVLPTDRSDDAVGGPGDLKPGHWGGKGRMRQGWRFFWANSGVRFDDVNDAFGLSYDLIGLWYTYKLIDGEWSPVWYYVRMQLSDQTDANHGQYFEGALIYPQRDSDDLQVGTIRLFFNLRNGAGYWQYPHGGSSAEFQNAWIEIDINHGGGMVAKDDFQIYDFSIDHPILHQGGPNSSDHYNGLWLSGESPALFNAEGQILDDQILQDNSFILAEWTSSAGYSMAVNAFDTDGNPFWMISFSWLCKDSNDPDVCEPDPDADYGQFQVLNDMLVPYPGFNPFWDGSDMSQLLPDYMIGVNRYGADTNAIGRKFDGTHDLDINGPSIDHRRGKLCVNLNLSLASGRTLNLRHGGNNSQPGSDLDCENELNASHEVRKVASLHHIDYELVNGHDLTSQVLCDLDQVSETNCKINLTWFTDDYYPNAQPMVTGFGAGFRHIDEICLESTGIQFDFLVQDYECQIDTPGNYRFHLVSRPNNDGTWNNGDSAVIASSKLLSITGAVDSSPETPILPAPVSIPSPSPESSSIGTTEGDLEISRSGSAVYTIPIMKVPGSGGLEPDIALRYDSQSGRGHMGVGWSLSGVSSIERCGQTLGQDGYNIGVTFSVDDRFCMGGQRLILESGSSYGAAGSTYRLEIDNFTRIILHGSSTDMRSYFTVHEKDGSMSTYGWNDSYMEDSAYVLAQASNIVYAWPISRNEDQAGNYIQFKYNQPGKDAAQPWIEWVPDEIWYTGNTRVSQSPYAHIKFISQSHSLSNEDAKYVFGEKLKTTRIISDIYSYSDGPMVRKYNLNYSTNHYGQKTLSSITECMDISDQICFDSTYFDWINGYVSIFNGNVSPVPQFTQEKFRGSRAGDVTGNGRQEIVFIRESQHDERAQFGVYKNANPDNNNLILTDSLVIQAACGAKVRDIGGWTLIDLEGNGYQGLVYVAKNCDNSALEPGIYYHPWNHQLNAFSQAFVRIADLSWSAVFDELAPRLTAMDLDGDGLSDLLLTRTDPEGGAASNFATGGWAYLNKSVGHEVQIGSPKSVRGMFEHIDIPDCDELDEQTDNYIFKLFDSPVASVDHSGRAALIGEARIIRECVQDRTRSIFSDLNQVEEYAISIAELEALIANRDIGVEVYERRSTAVFEIDPLANDFNAQATVWSEIRTLPDDKIIPTDYNLDGYTDYVTLRKNDGKTDVRLHINDGIALPSIEPNPVSVSVDFDLASSIQIRDFTGNGYPDFIAPSGNDGDRKRLQYYEWPWSSSPSGNISNGIDIHSIAIKPDKGDQAMILDMYGNNKNDIVVFRKMSGDDNYLVYPREGILESLSGSISGRYDPAYKINRIRNGFGAYVDISYKSLAQRSVYTRDTSGLTVGNQQSHAVYDIIFPIHVVSAIETLSPQYAFNNGELTSANYYSDGIARVEYYYVGAKIQGGGRGFLGFREVGSFDVRNRVLTQTEYRQDFPFIGLPVKERTLYIPSGSRPWPVDDSSAALPPCDSSSCGEEGINPDSSVQLSEKINIWRPFVGLDINNTGYHHPYRYSVEELSYSPTVSGGTVTNSNFVKRNVTTTLELDEYANPERVDVKVYNQPDGEYSIGHPALFSHQITTNYYQNFISEWQLGLLICSEVVSQRYDAAAPIARRSRFGYESSTKLLIREVIEPDNCTSDTGYQVKTSYQLDLFGNREITEIEGPEIPKRSTRSVFFGNNPAMPGDTYGRFANSTLVNITGNANDWELTQEVISRDDYGNPEVVKNGQGVRSYIAYDHAGREFYNASEDGSWTNIYFSKDHNHLCPNSSEVSYVEIYTSADTEGVKQYICKDMLDRETRSIAQGFSEGQLIRVDKRYDFASRILQTSEPYVSPSSSYCLRPSTVDSTCGMPSWTSIQYDPFGRAVKVLLPNGQMERSRYTGLVSTFENALGQETEIERNELGEKIRQTKLYDGSATTEFFYDAIGQLIETDGPLPDDEIFVQYDSLGNKTRITDPAMGVWQYKYNALGELICQMDAKSQSILIEYDRLGRQIKRSDYSNVSSVDDCTGFLKGETDWDYFNHSGNPKFGQLIQDENWYIQEQNVPRTRVTRVYDYDALGRLEDIQTNIIEYRYQVGSQPAVLRSEPYSQRIRYDEFGRIFQQFDASGDDRGELFEYNLYGYLKAVHEARLPLGISTAYRSVDAMDARGNLIKGRLGNDTLVTASYDPQTGAPDYHSELMDANPAFNDFALYYEYKWDEIGRLESRTDYSVTSIYEAYSYDGGNRLAKSWSSTDIQQPANHPDNSSFGWTLRQHLRYNQGGNILCKSDVSPVNCSTQTNYQYPGTAGLVGAGPHSVARILNTPDGDRTFSYDDNGNMISDKRGSTDRRKFYYNAFNKVQRLRQGEDHIPYDTHFSYNADRARMLKRVFMNDAITSRTHYIGNVEVVFVGDNFHSKKYRRSLAGVAIETIETGGAIHTRYQHKDHLGSIVALSTSDGEIYARMSFDAWGKRRDPNWIYVPWLQWGGLGSSWLVPEWARNMLSVTPRGFTGHEHLDQHGIIHMNGRIYDPHIARFLQADPFMESTSTLNRYAYVQNNPLAYTDPSGYFLGLKSGIKFLGGFALGGPLGGLFSLFSDEIFQALGPEVSSTLISIGSAFCGPAAPLCAAAGNFELARAYGASYEEALRAGIVAGASQWAFGSSEVPTGRQAAVQIGSSVISSQHPALGQSLMFLYGNLNQDFGSLMQEAAGHAIQYVASDQLSKVADDIGLSLQELNVLLALNSKLGYQLAGTTYDQENASIQGFFSRKNGLLGDAGDEIGVIWDINDTILNAQGLMDAVSKSVLDNPPPGGRLTGHSLGAWRVNNLVRMGAVQSGVLLALPIFALPTQGTTGICASNDWICGGGWINGFRPGTAPVPGAGGFFSHSIYEVTDYRNYWPGP